MLDKQRYLNTEHENAMWLEHVELSNVVINYLNLEHGMDARRWRLIRLWKLKEEEKARRLERKDEESTCVYEEAKGKKSFTLI